MKQQRYELEVYDSGTDIRDTVKDDCIFASTLTDKQTVEAGRKIVKALNLLDSNEKLQHI